MQMTMTLEDCTRCGLTILPGEPAMQTASVDIIGAGGRAASSPVKSYHMRGRMRGRRQASAAGSRSRIDGSDQAAGTRVLSSPFRKTTESRNLEDMKLLENRLTGGCLTALRQGSCPGTLSHTRPRGGVVVGRGASRAREAFGRLSAGVGHSGFRGASSETRRTHDELGRIHRHIQGRCAASRGIGYPAQSGGTRRRFLGQPTHLKAKA